jgi:hypothetical protein
MVATILKQVMQDMHLALPDDRSIAKIEVT